MAAYLVMAKTDPAEQIGPQLPKVNEMTTIHADQVTKLTVTVTNRIEAFVLDHMINASQWTSSKGVDKATDELEAAILAATIKYMRQCQAVSANGG